MKGLFTLLLVIAVAVGAWLFASQLPDIQRYMKMRDM